MSKRLFCFGTYRNRLKEIRDFLQSRRNLFVASSSRSIYSISPNE